MVWIDGCLWFVLMPRLNWFGVDYYSVGCIQLPELVTKGRVIRLYFSLYILCLLLRLELCLFLRIKSGVLTNLGYYLT